MSAEALQADLSSKEFYCIALYSKKKHSSDTQRMWQYGPLWPASTKIETSHFNSDGRRESHAIAYLLLVTDVCQLIIIWGEVQLFLCMQVNTIILCFITYGYSCAHIWLLLCQHYVTLTQLLYATCSVVYRVLIAHAKIFPYMVMKRNLSLISSIKTHSIAFSPSLLST